MKRNPLAFFCLLGTVAWLSSCSAVRQCKAPELNLPERMADVGPDTLSVADTKWWQFYGDTLLCRIIERTLSHNKDLLGAAANVERMRQLYRVSKAEQLPVFSAPVYAEYETNDYSGESPVRDPELGAKLTAEWELDLWGKLRWARRQGNAEYLASVGAQRAMRMSLVAEVATAYFQLIAMDNELAVVRRTLATRSEGVEQARLRFEGGLTSEMVYQQAQVEYARTATLVPDLERKISIKENDIAFLAGEYPKQIERSIMPDEVKLPESLPIGLPSTLLERRPDVRQAEQRLIAANAAVGIAYTNMFPKLSLTAQYGLESGEMSDLLKSPIHYLSANLLGPIFAMGKNRAIVKAKKAAYEQECYNYEKSVLTAFKDARNAIVDFNKIKEIYESRLQLERSSKTNMELAQLQYINGVIGYLDVLDAQRSYFDAQIGLSNAVRDKQITMVRLYKALGGGWQ